MIDAHAHVHMKEFDEDRDAVMRRAFDAGVKSMIMVGTDVEMSRKAATLAEKYENVWTTVGIHPHAFGGGDAIQENWIETLAGLMQHPKVVAIGEIGLDYFSRTDIEVTEEQRSAQKEGFVAQLGLAEKKALPVIIHTRPSALKSDDAYRDLLSLLKDSASKIPNIVLHCYQGDTEVTKEFLKIPNLYFSFTGTVTYLVNQEMRGTKFDSHEVVRKLPEDRMLIETDCPYLAPQQVRGKRCEPAFVCYTLQEIAEIKGIDATQLESQMEKNFKTIFSKSII